MLDLPDVEAEVAVLSSDVRLQLDIDGKRFPKTLVSKRGNAVTGSS